MVWQNTGEIGYGLASTSMNKILLNRYSPPGNLIWELPYGRASQVVAEDITFGVDEGAQV